MNDGSFEKTLCNIVMNDVRRLEVKPSVSELRRRTEVAMMQRYTHTKKKKGSGRDMYHAGRKNNRDC